MSKEQFYVDFPADPPKDGSPNRKVTIDEKLARGMNDEIKRLRDTLSLIGAGSDWAADVARSALLGEDVTGSVNRDKSP